MKVKSLKNGEILEVSDSYGARLIEQGAAVLPDKKPPAGARKKPAEKE